MADPRVVLGREVKRQRNVSGLSQEELAEKADLHRTYVGQVERGETNISLMNLVKLAKALRVRVRELVDEI